MCYTLNLYNVLHQIYFHKKHTHPKPGIVSSCPTWGTKKIKTKNHI